MCLMNHDLASIWRQDEVNAPSRLMQSLSQCVVQAEISKPCQVLIIYLPFALILFHFLDQFQCQVLLGLFIQQLTATTRNSLIIALIRHNSPTSNQKSRNCQACSNRRAGGLKTSRPNYFSP